MRLLPRRRTGARLTVTPDAAVRPTETVVARIELDGAVDGVTAARVELGYANRYSYRWAGKTSHAYLDDDLAFAGQVGTDYGSHRDTTDWVHVLDVPLPAPGGRLEPGPHAVPLRLPSWAPGSSESTVEWRVRLRVERSGRDVAEETTFTVVVPPPAGDEAPVFARERTKGDVADVVVAPDRDWWRPGETLTGRVTITTRGDGLRGDVQVRLHRTRTSHPLVRTPGGVQTLDRSITEVARDVELPAGAPVVVPFAVDVPDDADPTTESVHSSLDWFVQVRVSYPKQAVPTADEILRGIGIATA